MDLSIFISTFFSVRKALFVISLLVFGLSSKAQTISGNFSELPNQSIDLFIYKGLQTERIATINTDNQGSFNYTYGNHIHGCGYLTQGENSTFFLILNGENITLSGESLNNRQSVSILNGQENQWLNQYSQEHATREQAISAWRYLKNIYNDQEILITQVQPKLSIKQELKRLKNEDANFIAGLPQNSFLRWYLPKRNLVSAVSVIAQYRTEEIPATIKSFRAIDYSDELLYQSGLLKEVIESHFWLLENSGKPLDSVYMEMKTSIDLLLENLTKDEEKLNQITDYLFNLLERHSLFTASEHLAIKVLNEVSCTVHTDLAKQLETYRTMKKGNIAPDFELPHRVYPDVAFQPTKLSEFNSKYTLVVFGASWCPNCKEEIPKIADHYAHWKAQGVDVLLVSLDNDKDSFLSFTSNFPFISVSDYQGWESSIAKAYYVFGTPTMYLLDKNRKIILRPHSIKQMESWVDWYLVKGNVLPTNN